MFIYIFYNFFGDYISLLKKGKSININFKERKIGKFNSIGIFLRQRKQCESLILASITQVLKNPASFEMPGNYFKRFSVGGGR